jgi:hypothetical protein
MFHHLPPSMEGEIAARLQACAKADAPQARLAGLINLGNGVAYRVESDGLADIRALLADAFWDCLTPQDRAPWRAHVTIQNKVKPHVSRALLASLSAEFQPQPFTIAGLALWRYLGGPWEAVGAWRFGQGHRMSPPSPLPC